MNEDILMIKEKLEEMADVFNACAGKRFDLKCARTLLITERRLKDSELKKQMSIYNELFSEEDLPGNAEIADAAVSFIKIKVLCTQGISDFDDAALRNLLAELKAQKDRAENLIRLSRMGDEGGMAGTTDKYESILKAITDEISRMEGTAEKKPEPVPEKKEETAPETEADNNTEEEAEEEPASLEMGVTFLSELGRNISFYLESRKNRKKQEAFLKEEESRSSDTPCGEIPYYDASLKFTEKHLCRDIPKFSLFLKKQSVYFGKTDNAKGSTYDNSDGSLYELMSVREGFIKFMTGDLSESGEPLPDKDSMRMYFSFVCSCFDRHLGKELSVREYLDFKARYNRLVLKAEEEREEYYRALVIAERFAFCMDLYCMDVTYDREEIIKNILAGVTDRFVKDIEEIKEKHVADNAELERLKELSESIRTFSKKPETVKTQPAADKEPEDTEESKVSADIRIAVEILDEDGEVADEALYAAENLDAAVSDFFKEGSRRIGIEKDSVRTYPGDVTEESDVKTMLEMLDKKIKTGGKRYEY